MSYQVSLVVAGLALLISACQTSPEFSSFESDSRQPATANRYSSDGSYIVWQGRRYALIRDERILYHITRLGRRLVRAADADPNRYRFGVFLSDSPNAFSHQDGSVYVSSGLLLLIRNDAELAAVLGHEIAHVLYRHNRLLRASPGRRTARDLELTADRLGMEFAARIGYDPRQLIRLYRNVHVQAGNSTRTHFPAYSDARLRRIVTASKRLARRYRAYRTGTYRYGKEIRDGLSRVLRN